MKLSILHISDLHRDPGNPIRNDVLLDSLENDRRHYWAEETPAVRLPDLIIVSGDIVQGIRPDAPDGQGGGRGWRGREASQRSQSDGIGARPRRGSWWRPGGTVGSRCRGTASRPALRLEGVDLLSIKELGGWKSLAMVQRYAHLSPSPRRAAIERLVTRQAATEGAPVAGAE
jgi:3',5'-cyclic AMP phosphodiesterase CpdA